LAYYSLICYQILSNIISKFGGIPIGIKEFRMADIKCDKCGALQKKKDINNGECWKCNTKLNNEMTSVTSNEETSNKGYWFKKNIIADIDSGNSIVGIQRVCKINLFSDGLTYTEQNLSSKPTSGVCYWNQISGIKFKWVKNSLNFIGYESLILHIYKDGDTYLPIKIKFIFPVFIISPPNEISKVIEILNNYSSKHNFIFNKI